ncbi:MAG: DUF2007 domain-containing protein [Acidobacteria bacterium]|jgi:hypothetical protein|nr:DUF2007 domain-containing protein [Acidobacteriota bacterium]
MNDVKLKELMAVEGSMEAEIIKSKLESFDIPVLLQYEAAGRIFGITMDGLGKVRILVPQDLLEEAQKILAE